MPEIKGKRAIKKPTLIEYLKALVKEIEGRIETIRKEGNKETDERMKNWDEGYLTALEDIQDDITRVIEELEK